MTDAEKHLWRILRTEFAQSGTHFRRQFPVGPYVADFCCLKHRLIVELDGPVHDGATAAAYDRHRSAYLTGQDFRVLRFRNEDVTMRRDDILRIIHDAFLAATPTPRPSPQGGGEQRSRP